MEGVRSTFALAAALAFGCAACGPQQPDALGFEAAENASAAEATTIIVPDADSVALVSEDAVVETPPPTLAPTTTSTTPLSTTTTAPPPTTVPGPTEGTPNEVLLIGDSILEGLNYSKFKFGLVTSYDTAVSRSLWELPDLLAARREQGPLPQNIVIHLGTNGWGDKLPVILDEQIASLAGYNVVLINTSADRFWIPSANEAINATAAKYEYVTLLDWHAMATPELLRKDGFHPNVAGQILLAEMINAEILCECGFPL